MVYPRGPDVVTVNHWRFTLDPDLNGDSRAARFAAIWRTRTNGSLPGWKDFDIADFSGWYGLLMLTDHRAREAPFCKLYGTKLSILFGADFTGRHPADVVGGQRTALGQAFATHLGLVARELKPGLAVFDIEADVQDAPYRAVSLPLAGALVLSAFDVAPLVRIGRFDPLTAGLQT